MKRGREKPDKISSWFDTPAAAEPAPLKLKRIAVPPLPVEYEVPTDMEIDDEKEEADLIPDNLILEILDERDEQAHDDAPLSKRSISSLFRADFEASQHLTDDAMSKKAKKQVNKSEDFRDMNDDYGEQLGDDDEETEFELIRAKAKNKLPPIDVLDNFLSDKYLAPGQTNVLTDVHLRPAVDWHQFNPKNDFVFQHTNTTYGIDAEQDEPEIRLWGITKEGHSVIVRVGGFRPYFYVQVSSDVEMDLIRPRMEAYLSTKVKKAGRHKHGTFILNVEPVDGRSICGYHMRLPLSKMFKITMARPSYVAMARDAFEFGNRAVVNHSYETFEANVLFDLRYMVDTKIHGCQWLRLKGNAYKRSNTYKSSCEYELTCRHKNNPIEPISIDTDGSIAPLRILSYDIEVLRQGAGFPTPLENPAITICCALQIMGSAPLAWQTAEDKGIVHKACFVLKHKLPNGTYSHVNPIENAVVYEYEDERQLLLAFIQYVNECDPEALTGWNTSSFDMPYLAERAKQLDIFSEFMSFSRIASQEVWLRTQTFQSKAYGAKKSVELMCEGRFDYDGLVFMLRGQMEKYRSYTLNHIAEKVLKDTKLDVDHSQIPLLYMSDDIEDRTRLVHYCLKDAMLPIRILDKLMAVINGMEQARVTGVPMPWLLSRGQGIKTYSNLLRYKLENEYVPSRSPKSSTGDTAGGHVEEPRRGYYAVPVATLDFASLYPSIMIANNICYSTQVSIAWAKANLKETDYTIPPPAVDGGVVPNYAFVKKHIREGIMPRLLDTLLKARSNVKNMMKVVNGDMFLYSVLDGRQLALKVVCNSVYGFLKAFILRNKDLMSAVTSFGRQMLHTVKEVIHANFKNLKVVDVPLCRKMGIDPEIEPDIAKGEIDPRPYTTVDAFIVYGDTDSVMVCFGDILLKDVIRFGTEAAAQCTLKFEKPNSLTFEAIKLRGIWLNKKRYASLEIVKFIPGERMEDAIKRGYLSIKGLEGKRRDNASINSQTQNKLLEMLLRENDIPKMERFIESRIRDLLMDRIDISELVITKGLSKTTEQYTKGGSKQLHVELQKRMRKRANFTGEVVPETGDRVPYIVKAGTAAAKTSKGASKAFELSEHPLYAQRNGVPINTLYYINKQIWPAVCRIMTGIYEPEKCKEIESNMSEKKRSELKVYKRFFDPMLPHMRQVKRRKAGVYGIAQFALVLPQCVACGVRLTLKHPGPCCVSCNVEDAKRVLLEKKMKQQEKVDSAWDICRKCQGGSFQKVTCSNLTCKNFFHREQTLIDMEDLTEKLKKF